MDVEAGGVVLALSFFFPARVGHEVRTEEHAARMTDEKVPRTLALIAELTRHPLGGAGVQAKIRIALEKVVQVIEVLRMPSEVRCLKEHFGVLFQTRHQLEVMLRLRAMLLQVVDAMGKPIVRVGDVDQDREMQPADSFKEKVERRIIETEIVMLQKPRGEPELDDLHPCFRDALQIGFLLFTESGPVLRIVVPRANAPHRRLDALPEGLAELDAGLERRDYHGMGNAVVLFCNIPIRLHRRHIGRVHVRIDDRPLPAARRRLKEWKCIKRFRGSGHNESHSTGLLSLQKAQSMMNTLGSRFGNVFSDGCFIMAATKKILVVDDDQEILHAMRAVMESKGYMVMTASDGNAGLAVAERESPDLVIVDMMMPKKSGFLVLEKLKSRKQAMPRVIMITANEGGRHRAYAEMLGVDDYIRKPFAMDKLLESVTRLCPLKEEEKKEGGG